MTTVTGTNATITGLAFSPVDFNLWHPTLMRDNDPGHGVTTAFDNSRTPANESYTVSDSGPGPDRTRNEAEGGASLFFGLEDFVQNPGGGTDSYFTYQANAQLGIYNPFLQSDLSSAATQTTRAPQSFASFA